MKKNIRNPENLGSVLFSFTHTVYINSIKLSSTSDITSVNGPNSLKQEKWLHDKVRRHPATVCSKITVTTSCCTLTTNKTKQKLRSFLTHI